MRIVLREKPMAYERDAFASALQARGHVIAADDAEVLITGGTTLATADVDAHPRLATVIRFARGGADIEHERALLSERGIRALHVHGISAEATAEHAIAMLLALLRRLPESTAAILREEWCQQTIAEHGIHDLRELTLGIVGMGAVGRRIAALARAFGGHVVYTKRRRLDPAQERLLGIEYASLDALLATSDAVCLAARTAAAEQPLVTRARLARMRDGAVLVSVGSGGDIDLEALCEAMESGAIRCALDVFPQEPPNAGAFPSRGEVVLSPHVAGRSRATARAIAEAVAAAIPIAESDRDCTCATTTISDAVLAIAGATIAFTGMTVSVPPRLPHLAHAVAELGGTPVSSTRTDVDALDIAAFARIVERFSGDFAVWDALLPRHAHGSLPGRRLIVRGYDSVQRHIAGRARILGMDVVVAEEQPELRIEAILDGFPTADRAQLSDVDLIVERFPVPEFVPQLADEETAAILALLIARSNPAVCAESLFAQAFINAREGRSA
jgi:phosphoglycerate dehydrogenase-like enzyme